LLADRTRIPLRHSDRQENGPDAVFSPLFSTTGITSRFTQGMGSGMLPLAAPQRTPSPPKGSTFGMSPARKTEFFLHHPSSGGPLGTRRKCTAPLSLSTYPCRHWTFRFPPKHCFELVSLQQGLSIAFYSSANRREYLHRPAESARLLLCQRCADYPPRLSSSHTSISRPQHCATGTRDNGVFDAGRLLRLIRSPQQTSARRHENLLLEFLQWNPWEGIIIQRKLRFVDGVDCFRARISNFEVEHARENW
jgi:hypothetical protein